VTVADLIAKLQTMPQDAVVVVGYHDDYATPQVVEVRERLRDVYDASRTDTSMEPLAVVILP
jgi:ribosomal protein S24E